MNRRAALLGLGAGFTLAVVAVTWAAVSSWWRQDKCLDHGGCWVAEDQRCEWNDQSLCDAADAPAGKAGSAKPDERKMVDLDAEFERACSRPHEGAKFDALPERDRILIAIWGLEADVNNGGFDQYYFNSSGDQAFFAPIALDKIGASRMAAIVREANSHFGREGPSRDRDTRQRELEAITEHNELLFDKLDRHFYDYPDDIAALLTAYLASAIPPKE